MPPATAQPDRAQRDSPVTHDDLRLLRRWVVVAGVWAVAATAVALIALLDDSGRDAERRANQTGERVARREQAVDRRIASLDARLRALPSSGEVARLRTQVAAAQQSASGARSATSALERRVDALERTGGDDSAPSAPDDGAGGSSGSGDGDLPTLRDLFP